jgi:hypothetical protein
MPRHPRRRAAADGGSGDNACMSANRLIIPSVSAVTVALLSAALMASAFAADAPPEIPPKTNAAPAEPPALRPDTPPTAQQAPGPALRHAVPDDAEPQPVFIDEIGANGRLRTHVRVELSNAPTVESVLSSLKNVAMLSASAIVLLVGSAAVGILCAGLVLLVRKRRELRVNR